MKKINSFFSLLCLMVFATSCSPDDNIGTVIEDGEYETPDLENPRVSYENGFKSSGYWNENNNQLIV